MKRLNKFFLALAAVVALSVLGASTASAQCTVTAYAPGTLTNSATLVPGAAPTLAGNFAAGTLIIPIPRVRAQGTTETLATIMVACTAIAVAANNSITVTLAGVNFAPSAAAGGANNTSTFPAPLIARTATAAGGAGAGSANLSATGAVVTSVSGATAVFGGITNSGAIETYTIAGIRANIAASGLTDGVITATVSTAGTGFASAAAFVVPVARVVSALSGATAQVWPRSGVSSAVLNNFPSCAPPRITPSGTSVLSTSLTFAGVSTTLDAAGPLSDDSQIDVRIARSTPDPIPGINDVGNVFKPRLDPTTPIAPGVTFNTEDWGGATSPGTDNIYGDVLGDGAGDDTLGGAIQGTRFAITLTGIPSGITVWAPRSLPANASVFPSVSAGGATQADMVRVIAHDPDGSGGGLGTPVRNQVDRIDPVGGTAVIVYEMVATHNNTGRDVDIVLTGANPIATGVIKGELELAPLGPPTASSGRPQFGGGRAVRNVVNVAACGSYLLFPWVVFTGDGAFDTGMAIANTSADPAGPAPGGISTAPQTGDVTLYFWRKDGGTNPAPQTIAKALPAGQTTTFVASTLKDPFLGYIIAVCGFPFGHGFAFINSPSPGTGGSFAQGYQALSLPNPRAPAAGVPQVFIESNGL